MQYYERHMPHLQPEEGWLFITWRLAGSLPRHLRMVRDEVTSSGRAFGMMDRALDRESIGPLWLADSRIAAMVCDVIRESESRQLAKVGPYVVMSNHVHLLAQPTKTATALTKWIKGKTAREANRILGRTGQFWHHESYDHWVRSSDEFNNIVKYIERNPVKAGLVLKPDDYRWSSASSTS